MDFINSQDSLNELITNDEMLLVYFGDENCNVCVAIKPKLEEILKKYPNIKSVQIDVEKSIQIAASYNIFTIPAILLFIEGKETMREARYISMQNTDNVLSRYYNLFFE